MRKLVFVFFLVFFVIMTSVATASVVVDKVYDETAVWPYIIIRNEEDITPSEGIVMFMAGGGWHGNDLDKLLTGGIGAYAINNPNTGWLPSGYWLVQPQERHIAEFRETPDSVYEFVCYCGEMADRFGCTLIVAGASNGGGAAFEMLLEHPYIADGWCILSGCRPKSANGMNGPEICEDILMVYGGASDGNERGAREFDYIFGSNKSRDDLNSYLLFVRGWHHEDTPKMLHEAFFWEWVKEVRR